MGLQPAQPQNAENGQKQAPGLDMDFVRPHLDAINHELKKIGYTAIPVRERPAYRLKDLAAMLGAVL